MSYDAEQVKRVAQHARIFWMRALEDWVMAKGEFTWAVDGSNYLRASIKCRGGNLVTASPPSGPAAPELPAAFLINDAVMTLANGLYNRGVTLKELKRELSKTA